MAKRVRTNTGRPAEILKSVGGFTVTLGTPPKYYYTHKYTSYWLRPVSGIRPFFPSYLRLFVLIIPTSKVSTLGAAIVLIACLESY